MAGLFLFVFCAADTCVPCFWLSLPVQLIAWKDSSAKWPNYVLSGTLDPTLTYSHSLTQLLHIQMDTHTDKTILCFCLLQAYKIGLSAEIWCVIQTVRFSTFHDFDFLWPAENFVVFLRICCTRESLHICDLFLQLIACQLMACVTQGRWCCWLWHSWLHCSTTFQTRRWRPSLLWPSLTWSASQWSDISGPSTVCCWLAYQFRLFCWGCIPCILTLVNSDVMVNNWLMKNSPS